MCCLHWSGPHPKSIPPSSALRFSPLIIRCGCEPIAYSLVGSVCLLIRFLSLPFQERNPLFFSGPLVTPVPSLPLSSTHAVAGSVFFLNWFTIVIVVPFTQGVETESCYFVRPSRDYGSSSVPNHDDLMRLFLTFSVFGVFTGVSSFCSFFLDLRLLWYPLTLRVGDVCGGGDVLSSSWFFFS